MANTSITVQTPGKLMTAGEFAVLEPYQQLVVMAVDRYVYATITECGEGRLSLPDFGLMDLPWEITSDELYIDSDDTRIRFVEDAMKTVFFYLQEQSAELFPFELSIRSELDDVSGVKYGLGSSAAVVTSVVAAILHAYLPEKPSKRLLFKLAAISHVKTQGSGSGADVAASSYGGFLCYSSFQADWLLQQLQHANSITGLVQQDWPYFSIQPISMPDDVYLCIGWTGNPASTSKLIPKIRGLNDANATLYEQFLHDSTKAVSAFLRGVEIGNRATLFTGVQANRHALATVGEKAGVAVETPLLKKLCDLAEQYGGVGKPSGAGGGDCGIAFMPDKQTAEQLQEAWQHAGIKPLAIQPAAHGATVLT